MLSNFEIATVTVVATTVVLSLSNRQPKSKDPTTLTMMRFFLPVLILAASPTLAFTTLHTTGNKAATSLRLTELICLTDAELPDASVMARGECGLWFFGASGAAGIARGAIPKTYNKYVALQELKGLGPTKGGETFGLDTFLCGIPEDISKADVKQLVSNPLSVNQIVEKFPEEGNYLASKGYLCFQAFQNANAAANPLAVRAVFDSLSAGGSNTINPEVAQEKLDTYKTNLDAFKSDLLKANLTGILAIFTLLFLLGLADIVAFTDFKDGWFPDWPGGVNFPFGLFQPGGSLFDIPDYWI